MFSVTHKRHILILCPFHETLGNTYVHHEDYLSNGLSLSKLANVLSLGTFTVPKENYVVFHFL